MLHYCSSCGCIKDVIMYKPGGKYNCPKCGKMLHLVMREYLSSIYDGCFKSDEAEEEFKQRYIYKSKDSQKIKDTKDDKIDEFIKVRQMARDGVQFTSEPDSSIKKQTYTPKCPTCGSPNISGIGTVERAGSVAAFGLASKKIGKTFKCSNCGYTW